MNPNNNFDQIISQIERDEQQPSSIQRARDDNLLESTEKEQKQDFECDRRNELYTKLLEQYIKTSKSKDSWKKWYKLVFFIVTLLAFVAIIVCSLLALIWTSLKAKTVLADFGTVIGSVAGILSALIVIPKIIAEHLFPANEDSNVIKMVKNMQQNDAGIRESLSHNGQNKKSFPE